MVKFNRAYRLDVEKRSRDGDITIELPFTVEFEIHRNSFSSANIAQFRIYNLNPNNRGQIQRNQYDALDQRIVEFHAGYGNNLSLGFKGRISQAWSQREGVDFITTIESYDGGFAYNNAITNIQFPANTQQQTIVEDMATSMTKPDSGGLSLGAIGTFPGSIPRGNTFTGNTTKILSEMVGDGFFIDNEKVNCLSDTECIAGTPFLINSQAGLLGTPLVEESFIQLEMIFEPSLRVGQLVELDSTTADEEFTGVRGTSKYNGIHKVIGIRHRGMISAAVCGNAISTVSLLPGNFTEVESRS